MHPREFYGPAIYRQMIKTKVGKGDSHPVDILHSKDFYSRMKAAGLRKTANQDENLNKFLRLDAKFPHLMQMKRVVKALEEVAQVEQKKMQEEHQKKMEAEDEKMAAG
jgi:L-fucose mutarotase/ribose pyranase (RbsD/FucU family)